jgi:hypothetical protein
MRSFSTRFWRYERNDNDFLQDWIHKIVVSTYGQLAFHLNGKTLPHIEWLADQVTFSVGKLHN